MGIASVETTTDRARERAEKLDILIIAILDQSRMTMSMTKIGCCKMMTTISCNSNSNKTVSIQ